MNEASILNTILEYRNQELKGTGMVPTHLSTRKAQKLFGCGFYVEFIKTMALYYLGTDGFSIFGIDIVPECPMCGRIIKPDSTIDKNKKTCFGCGYERSKF